MIAQRRSTDLGERVWPELSSPRTLLVPLGALEQHGPHLPLDTDTRVAAEVARRASLGTPDLVVTPPVTFGASGEHEGFPGTISIGHQALHTVLVEIGRSASRWARRVVFVNGHGGNLPTVDNAVTQLRAEGRDADWFACVPPGEHDAHAGRTETSLMLALAPELVRVNEAKAGATAPLRDLLPELRRRGIAAVSPNGVLGDPSSASAAEGERLLNAMAEALRARVRAGGVATPADAPVAEGRAVQQR